eukprot:TRINITY_DN2312_c0_g1_i2.p1 TRINITY_DN2312_c0_g1~~TRINITY_DN2312_c0_g1_i2.p1  ORF type:complete len:494 (+),score=210.67 TRINITY_DN2312_c0_g1_i2:63-1544(+)
MKMAAVLSMLSVGALALEVFETSHVDLPQGVDGLPGAVLSDDGTWVYVSGNGVVNVFEIKGSELDWVSTVSGGSGCGDVRGLKAYSGTLFMLCGTAVQVFTVDAQSQKTLTYSGKLPLYKGTGVAMDTDTKRGHLWVLASDMNYELQEYDIRPSAGAWDDSARLLDAINLQLPLVNQLSDLAVYIEDDVLILTTSSLTQKRDLSSSVTRPVEVVKKHKYVAVCSAYTALSLVSANGATDIEVYPNTAINSISFSVYSVPFEVTDIAFLNGVLVAAGAEGALYLVDPATGISKHATLQPKTNTLTLTALQRKNWVVAASRSALTVVTTIKTPVLINAVPAGDVLTQLSPMPKNMKHMNVFGGSRVGAGSVISISCNEAAGCDVIVAVYHCPPCSRTVNGGLPSILTGLGWTSGSCLPGFIDSDFNGAAQPMVGFHTVLQSGETVTLPDTTKESRFLAVFIGAKQSNDMWWCSRQSGGSALPMPPNPCLKRCATA